MRMVRFAIFYLVNYLIGNHHAVLPSFATALLYEDKPHVPRCTLPRLQSRTPKRNRTIDRESGEFWNLFHLVNYLIWNVMLTCLLLQWPSSTNYIHYAPRRALPWLQPNTKIKQRDNWPCKWWVLQMLIFSSIIYFDLAELTCHLLPPPSYMNHKPHAAPSRGFNLKEARQLTTPMVSFVNYFILSTI